MTTQEQLDNLTANVGNALREAWQSGYDIASKEILSEAIHAIELRQQTSANPHALDTAIAVIKGLMNTNPSRVIRYDSNGEAFLGDPV
jgi:hypothetical protein